MCNSASEHSGLRSSAQVCIQMIHNVETTENNQQRNQIIEQAQLLNVLKKHFVNECYYSTKEAKRLENQMMMK